MKRKKLEVILIPEDFNDAYYTSPWDCPLARAVKRVLGNDKFSVDSTHVYGEDAKGSRYKSFKIKDEFCFDDYDFVGDKYEKDPKMLKARYVVTLLPI